MNSQAIVGWTAQQRGPAKRRMTGFTMLELVVVLAIMGILTVALLPMSETWLRAKKERELREALWEIRDALDRYKRAHDLGHLSQLSASENGYPPDLITLAKGAPKATGPGNPGFTGDAGYHYFLRRIPRDPFADPLLPPEKTWGLRSYASSPERPEAGKDVFDVYSTSKEQALDGSFYKNW